MKHKIEYTISLTGSKLFDMVTYSTAKKVCTDFPGLQLKYLDEKHIQIYGELNDFWNDKFKAFVIGN